MYGGIFDTTSQLRICIFQKQKTRHFLSNLLRRLQQVQGWSDSRYKVRLGYVLITTLSVGVAIIIMSCTFRFERINYMRFFHCWANAGVQQGAVETDIYARTDKPLKTNSDTVFRIICLIIRRIKLNDFYFLKFQS